MSDTCGLTSFDLFGPVDQKPSTESKSPVEPDSSGLMVKVRTCRTCGTEQPYSEFYVNSKGNRRNSCKACVTAAERLRKRSEPDAVSERHKAWRLEKRGHALTNVAKHRAKTKGLPFDLDPAEIQAVIDAGRCQVTGIEFDLSEPRAWNAPSLDQKAPGAGYTKANVRVVLYALNVMANTWGTQRISQIASAISDRQRERSDALTSLIGERLKEAMTTRDSPVFDLTWKSVATPSGRRICALRARAHSTSGSGSTGWPTATKQDAASSGSINYPKTATHNPGLTLTDAARMSWPTPRTEDSESTGARRGKPDTLHSATQLASWATPATPATRDYKSNEGSPEFHETRAEQARGKPLSEQTHQLLGQTLPGSTAATAKPAQLNPAFSLWLMGYPVVAWLLAAPSSKPAPRFPKKKPRTCSAESESCAEPETP